MNALQTQITDVVTKLTAVAKELDSIEALEARAASAKANLDATNAFLETTKNELTKASTGLSAAQAKNVQQYDENIYTSSRELADLGNKIGEAKEELQRLKVETVAARQAHDEILASIESLRKRIA